MSACELTVWITLMSTALLSVFTDGTSVALHSSNIDDILHHNEVVLVNFYADWCRFSQMLKPIYEETAKKLAAEFPGTGKVALGTVDCDRETSIAQKYQVTKYPTLKLFRNGQLVKREYRGQRSVDSMAKFIRDQVQDPIQRTEDLDSLEELNKKKRHVIGYFDSEDSPDFDTYKKIAVTLRDDCQFHAVIGPASEKERSSGNKMVFRPVGEYPTDTLFTGPLSDFKYAQSWANDKCVPLVREITFENAEELTEEGLPFLILFHHVDDTETPEAFRRVIQSQLLPEKSAVNFLTADGEKFTHPLYHLGKTAKDLPVLAIDSFRHMYIWKNDPKSDIEKPGLLLQFVKDLQSGKLHREFHHGPDPTPAVTKAPNVADAGNKDHVPKEDNGESPQEPPKPTTPPESSFKKLAPSKTRYTLLRDEL